MSTTQVSSCAPVSESNIPLPKRVQTGVKKPKGGTQLPELQKYINTIIKASTECDSDSTSASDRDKYRKERKFGRYSVYKGINNKIKHDKFRMDLNTSRRKNLSRPGTTDRVSSGETTPSEVVSGFEDPRNWKFNKIQDTTFSLKVEKFLQELYPNPYHLDGLNEFSETKNTQNETSKESVLPEATTSVCDTETHVTSENNDCDTPAKPDVVINSNRETKEPPESKIPVPITTPENPNSQKQDESDKSLEPEPEPPKRTSWKKFRNFPSNTSSSVESVTSTTDSLKSMIKRKHIKANRKRSSKEMVQEVKAKPLATSTVDKHADFDLGKLKLLSSADVGASVSKKMRETKNKSPRIEEYLKVSKSKIYKQEELNDLRKIHEVMNKANESFLLISEKSQTTGSNASGSVTVLAEREKNVPDKVEGTHYDVKNEESVNNNPEKAIVSAITQEKKTSQESPKSLQAENSNTKSETEQCLEVQMKQSSRELPKLIMDSGQSVDITEHQMEKCLTDDANTTQKIDEVLEFMYDCLMKFSSSEELVPEEEAQTSLVKRIFSTDQISFPTTSKLHEETDTFFRKTSPVRWQNPGLAVPIETSRKHVRTRCRKSEFVLQPENKSREISPPVANADGQPALYINAEVNNSETYIPTVETQNELGGYTEDSFSSDSRLSKQVFPLPGKLNKSKTDARNIREVLETEEKLFARDYSQKERTECARPKELATCKMQDDYRLNEPSNVITSGLKCPSSNFVICVNSLPRNLKTFKAVTPMIAIPKMPLINIKEHREIKPITGTSEYGLRQYFLPSETRHRVLTCNYRLKQGSLFKMDKLTVEYIAVPICHRVELHREDSIKNSECFLKVEIKTVKKPTKVSKITRSSLTIPNTPALISSVESGVNFQSEDERRVEALVEAIEDAEGKILLLQQINDSSLGNSVCSCSHTNESSFENGGKTDQKKVCDLLMRTYNLQLKLQDCLYKITGMHPSMQNCSFRDQESITDFNIYVNEKVNVDEVSVTETTEKEENSQPLVHWYPVPQQQTKVEEAMVDSSTSYNPPEEEESNTVDEKLNEPLIETEKGSQNEEDASSVCSFKSSNELSEGSDECRKESTLPEHMSKREFLKKIHNEIESLKQTLGSGNRHKEDSKNAGYSKDFQEQEQNQNSLVQYDAKTPGKTLKTVFKGRESSTELTIGLKDIPMTQVKNISVEKMKLSPNHTKISICISKDKAKEIKLRNVNSDLLHNKLPSYCYQNFEPSLKGPTSREEDDSSKTTPSVNEESEDDEDDYKSVGSTVDESEENPDPEKSAPTEHKIVKSQSAKKLPKYRFDFYRKMNTNFEDTGAKPKTVSDSLCRYKELEPLKQAMTEMQIRMRSIKRDALFNANDYYERALKLAKMSAGYCQSCGNRAVIPNDTFGYYKSLMPRRYTTRGYRHYKTSISSDPSFYSFRSSNADVGEHFCDLDIKHSSYLLNRTTHSNRTILRSSINDMPVLLERM